MKNKKPSNIILRLSRDNKGANQIRAVQESKAIKSSKGISRTNMDIRKSSFYCISGRKFKNNEGIKTGAPETPLRLVKESEASKAARIEEGRAYIKSMMAAWARDYELNSVGKIVKKQKTILYMNQQFSKQKPQ